MELDQKLERLRSTVLKDASVLREERLEQLKIEKTKYIRAVKEEVSASTDAYIAEEERKLEKQAKKARSALELEQMRTLRKKRLEIEERVLDQLRARLLAFTESAGYEAWLQARLNELAPELKEAGVIACCRTEAEERFLRAALPGARVERDPAMEIGGFRLKNETRQTTADCTLDQKLAEARASFLQITGLR